MVTEIEVRFDFFKIVDFLYDFSLKVGDFVVKMGLSGLGLSFLLNVFFAILIIINILTSKVDSLYLNIKIHLRI